MQSFILNTHHIILDKKTARIFTYQSLTNNHIVPKSYTCSMGSGDSPEHADKESRSNNVKNINFLLVPCHKIMYNKCPFICNFDVILIAIIDKTIICYVRA